MDDMYLDVSAGYVDDCRITQIDYHSFLPYSTSALSNNDEVRIALHNTESYTLPCESYIYIERTITKPAEITDDIRFINNGLAFLFSEMRYELNGIQIQKLANPGITTTLKGYCSYNKSDIVSRYNAAWDYDIKNFNKDFIESSMFNGCINLKDLFGFCEDYKRILINCNQQLILNRASIDINAVKQYKNNDVVLDAPKLKDVKINITKILWRMPIVKVSDREKIRLLKL
uniref:Double jelly roll-like domain-containing protein n=1 Tax=Schizaphis graminum TaxID=13262 RepID=A0A2S2NYL8_SCHGA